jgi:hypothetical protein
MIMGLVERTSVAGWFLLLRKIIKNWGHFPGDAVVKLLWLAICTIEDNGPVTVPRKPGSAAARNAKPKDAWSKDRSPPTGSKHSPNSPSSTPNDSTPTYDQLHLPYTEDLTGSRGQSGSR